MRGARAQVTMFFMIGLVLIFTIAIFYLITRSEQPVSEPTQSDTMNSYISGCIDSVVEGKLRELGEDGGVFRDDLAADPSVVGTIGTEKVLKGVTPKDPDRAYRILPQAYRTPRYPDWGVTLADTEVVKTDDGWERLAFFQDGYFGDVNLPAVCRPGVCRHYLGLPGLRGIGSPQVSVQERLEQQITIDARQCINEGNFEQYTGRSVTVTRQPTVNVSLTPHAVLVGIGYSLSVDGQEQDLRFEPRYSVRYLDLAQYAIDLARKDTRDINFDIATDYKTIDSYRDGFAVVVKRDAIPGADGADLVTITDAQSRVAGKQYEYRFLIGHRPPMLDWMTRAEAEGGCRAADPDDQAVICDWQGTTFFVRDSDLQRDCLAFDVDGSPKADSSISC